MPCAEWKRSRHTCETSFRADSHTAWAPFLSHPLSAESTSISTIKYQFCLQYNILKLIVIIVPRSRSFTSDACLSPSARRARSIFLERSSASLDEVLTLQPILSASPSSSLYSLHCTSPTRHSGTFSRGFWRDLAWKKLKKSRKFRERENNARIIMAFEGESWSFYTCLTNLTLLNIFR